MTIILNNRHDITLAALKQVAWRGQNVQISAGAQRTMTEARARFMRLLEDPDRVIYGVTSGYGQFAYQRFTPAERRRHAARASVAPVASHGDPLPDRVSRGIVLARLANFIDGHAGISPALALAVAEMLQRAQLPPVPARGQGGAGEILSLAPLFIDLMESHALAEKDALCLVNGSPAAAALLADAAIAAAARLDLAAEVLALAADAFQTPLQHYAATLAEYWNNAGDAWAIERLQALLAGAAKAGRRPFQAPVSFRILPRILGQAKEALMWAERIAEASLSAVSDNPVMLPADAAHPDGAVISTGGYHNAQSPMAMDALVAASANLALLAERYTSKLQDGAVSGLPAQLGAGESGIYLGCLAMAAAGYAEEMRTLAQATLLPGSESGGYGQNDVASPIFFAWSKYDRAGHLLEQALATLAPVAVRAYQVCERRPPPALRLLYDQVAGQVGHFTPSLRPGLASAAVAQAFHMRIFGENGGA